MSSSVSGDHPAATVEPRQDRPVYLLFDKPDLGEEIALDLRNYGFRARSFVNVEVLRNASRSAPPGVLLVEQSALEDPQAFLTLSIQLQELCGREIPLLMVGLAGDFGARLAAVQAGAAAFFPQPVNLPALVHQLHRLADAQGQGSLRALVVDDSGDSLLAVTDGLCRSGIEATRITEPAQVLERLAGQDFDILLVSALLDGLEAPELIQVVRQSGRHYGLPALILTPQDKRRLDESATSAGVDTIVGLPVDTKDLAAICRSRSRRAADLGAAYQFLAKRDPDTGLFNTRYFLEALRQALGASTGRHRDTVGVAYLRVVDCDGDPELALRAVADRLRRALPPLAVPARIAAEGLAVLIHGAGPGELEQLVALLAERFRQVEVESGAFRCSARCAIGMTLLGSHVRSAADAVQRARAAAEVPETSEPSHQAPAEPALDLEFWAPEIRRALQQNRFRLVYQPIASLSGQPTAFYEVFLRMLDGDGRDILPQEFLPAAERAGLAGQIDRWVLERAIHVLQEQQGRSEQPTLFVKLFPESVCDDRFAAWLQDRLSRGEIRPQSLVIQVTQQAASTRLSETYTLTGKLAEMDCGFALEHFGAGGDLRPELIRQLTPGYVKLSAQLTHDIGGNIEHQKAVEGVASACRAVGARPVASLVQDAINLSVLWRCGVEYIQGYFMQEPVDVFSPDEELG